MGHQHVWQKEPPDGINRTSDERYGDTRDMAHNSFWTSKEELQELRLLLKKDPNFENSADWPMVVEWCSSCPISRVVKLVLPEETTVFEPAPAQDACTQTPSRTRKRRGGGGSRFRRLLAHQLMLSERWGLPLSKLLLRSNMKTEAKSSKVALQKVKEKQTLPMLIKEEVELEVKVKEEKEKVMPCSAGASTGGQTLFTPRSNQPEKVNKTPKPALHCPETPPFSNFSAPHHHFAHHLHFTLTALLTIYITLHHSLLHSFTLRQPDAWLPVGFVWGMPRLGHNCDVLVQIQKLHEACLLSGISIHDRL